MNDTDIQGKFGGSAYSLECLKTAVAKKSLNTDLIPAPQGLSSQGSATATEAGPADAGINRDLIKAMAMDAGKSLCAYLEVMFPEVWHGQNSGFKISMKHHVYNDIMALADLHDEAAIRKRLATNEAHRKEWVGAYRKMRRKK